jgi:DUF1680 family protein
VYCVEEVDTEPVSVSNLILPDQARLTTEFHPYLLGGVQILRGEAIVKGQFTSAGQPLTEDPRNRFVAIPYYAWAHRGSGEMAVWLERSP